MWREIKMLKPKELSPELLLLDPNNPRLLQNFKSQGYVKDEDAEDEQDSLLDMFKKASPPSGPPSNENEEDGSVFIGDLKNSIKQIGFVRIQNIIVREIGSTGKYIVIEGNRRVATIKIMLRDHEQANPGNNDKIDDPDILASLESLEVMVLQTEGKTQEQIRNDIKTILGLRHIGGNLEWEPLPKGRNIFEEYMKLCPEDASFSWDPKKGNKIADILAITRPKVKKSMQDYLCWVQMGKFNNNVKAKHFSLISACVSNTNLKNHGFLTIDDKTFELSAESQSKINDICEFDQRDNRSDDQENILKDPKAVGRLGNIFKDSKYNENTSVRDFAKGVFQEVLDRERGLDDAYTALTAFKRQTQWVESVKRLLEKQENEPKLTPDRFLNQGAELEEKTDLERLVKRFLILMET